MEDDRCVGIWLASLAGVPNEIACPDTFQAVEMLKWP